MTDLIEPMDPKDEVDHQPALRVCDLERCDNEFEDGITVEFEGYSIFQYCSTRCAFVMMVQELICGHGKEEEDLVKIITAVRADYDLDIEASTEALIKGFEKEGSSWHS